MSPSSGYDAGRQEPDPIGGSEARGDRVPWAAGLSAALVVLYGAWSMAVNVAVWLPTCAQTGEYCDGMEGVAELLFADGMIGSFLIVLCGWKIWQRRRWAWVASIAYFTGATLWTLNAALDARGELEFSWIAVPFVLNFVIAGCLLLPQVVRWCRPDRADHGSSNAPGSTNRRS